MTLVPGGAAWRLAQRRLGARCHVRWVLVARCRLCVGKQRLTKGCAPLTSATTVAEL